MLLATHVWVSALIRRAEIAGAFAMVARKGDAQAGAVLVRTVNLVDGVQRLFAEATRRDGQRVWMQPVSSHEAPDLDRYVERAVRIDPDIWVVDIEDREGRHFLTEPVEQA